MVPSLPSLYPDLGARGLLNPMLLDRKLIIHGLLALQAKSGTDLRLSGLGVSGPLVTQPFTVTEDQCPGGCRSFDIAANMDSTPVHKQDVYI